MVGEKGNKWVRNSRVKKEYAVPMASNHLNVFDCGSCQSSVIPFHWFYQTKHQEKKVKEPIYKWSNLFLAEYQILAFFKRKEKVFAESKADYILIYYLYNNSS